MTLLVATGVAGAILLALTLVYVIAPLWRLLGAVAVGVGVAAYREPQHEHFIFIGIAAGFFAVILVVLWELLVVAGDAQRMALVRRPPR